jgi:uncharacterized membrane protein YhiD involved in acid resistance
VLNLDTLIGSNQTFGSFLLCTLVSLLLGAVIAACSLYKNSSSKGFVLTLATLPAMVQMVIMLVNGNIGTGVAVAGAFSLVRFRSVPGQARDIALIFLAMATGLATGTGNIAMAAVFTGIICIVTILYTKSAFGEKRDSQRDLTVTIPEGLDYIDIFDDIFDQYLKNSKLNQVKTTNLGSMYKLSYEIELRDPKEEKKMIDEIRTRNGNLEIVCAHSVPGREEL